MWDHFCWQTFLVQGSGNLDAIQIIKKLGGNLVDSYLDEGNHCRPNLNSKFYCFKYMWELASTIALKANCLLKLALTKFNSYFNLSYFLTYSLQIKSGFLLDKKIGVNQPKKMENAKILIANTAMDADKIKVGYKSSINIVVTCVASFLCIKSKEHK